MVGSDFIFKDSNNYWSHGFIWQNDVTTDLNTLIPADSNLFIIAASNINERGQISGMATVQAGPHKGEIHAYLLTPVDGSITPRWQISHVHTRISFFPRMLATTLRRDSDLADWCDKAFVPLGMCLISARFDSPDATARTIGNTNP